MVKCINLVKARRQHTLRQDVAVHENAWTELEILKALRRHGGHTNIVEFKDVHYDHKNMYLVMEHCAQGDLFNYISNNVLSPAKAFAMFEQIVDGVAFLHSCGFAHLDLSLENILLDRNGVCKLSDFGLAAKTNVRSHKVVGKMLYRAPEVSVGDTYDPVQADSWSLGIILYVLLTGLPLFESAVTGDEAFDYYCQYGLTELFSARGKTQRISKKAISLLSALLQLKPSERISTRRLASLLTSPLVNRFEIGSRRASHST